MTDRPLWSQGLKPDELPECLRREPLPLNAEQQAHVVPPTPVTAQENLQSPMSKDAVLARGLNLIQASKVPDIQKFISRRREIEMQIELCGYGWSDNWLLRYAGVSEKPAIKISRDVVSIILKDELSSNTAALEALGVDPWK